MKMSMFSALLMMGLSDDDDWEDEYKDAGRSMLMLTTPAILGLIGRSVADSAEWFSDTFD